MRVTGRARRAGGLTLALGLAAAVLGLAAAGLRRLPAAGPLAPGRPAPAFQKGMVFGLFAREDPAHTDSALEELSRIGVSSICIVVPWVTPDVRSLEMAPRGDMTPSDDSLAYAVGRARSLGMTVFLMPLLYVDHMEEGEWRGTLAPPDWSAWFRVYTGFILRYARLAGREGVEYFSVGSELCSTERRREDWLALIEKVRRVYRGRVTYSANWDHRDGLTFVDALDMAGLNAYFKVGEAPGASEQEMTAAWEAIRLDLEGWAGRLGKRILFTEVGYPSRTGAGVDPWNYEAEGTADPEEQRRCYSAFARTWRGRPTLEGVYFYLWWGAGGLQDTGYTPRGKPALEVVRRWYSDL